MPSPFLPSWCSAAAQYLLRETKEEDLFDLVTPGKRGTGEYISVLKNREFAIHAGAAAGVTGCLFAYIAGSPFVLIDLFGFSATQFGWIYGSTHVLSWRPTRSTGCSCEGMTAGRCSSRAPCSRLRPPLP